MAGDPVTTSREEITGAEPRPAPGSGRLAVPFGLFAGPLAWSVQLLVEYGFASHYCFPGDLPLPALPPEQGWVWPLLVAVHSFTLLLSALSAVTSFLRWRRLGRDGTPSARGVLEVGEGRARFLALWGIIIGASFTVWIAFGFIALFLVPPCG